MPLMSLTLNNDVKMKNIEEEGGKQTETTEKERRVEIQEEKNDKVGIIKIWIILL